MIELLDLKPVNWKNVRAIARVNYYGLEISDIKIIQEEGKTPFIRFPEIVFYNESGEKVYKHILKASEEVKKELNRIILPEYLKMLASFEAGLKELKAGQHTGLNQKN